MFSIIKVNDLVLSSKIKIYLWIKTKLLKDAYSELMGHLLNLQNFLLKELNDTLLSKILLIAYFMNAINVLLTIFLRK